MNLFASFLLVVVISITGCAGSHEHTGKADLAKQFHTFFGFEPPSSVTDLRARTVHVGDTMVDWLSFKSSPEVFERVIRSDEYKVASREDVARWWESKVPHVDRANPNAPKWWPKDPAATIQRLYFRSHPYVAGKTPSQSSEEYLWRDESSGIVFAYYSAWR